MVHSHCAKILEQQDTVHCDSLEPKTIVVCNHALIIHCESMPDVTFLPPLQKGKTIVVILPLALTTCLYHSAAVAKFDK